MKFYLILAAFYTAHTVYAQSSLPPFGQYTHDETSLQECTFDKSAGAVILLDEAASNYDDDYRLITHRRTRIKILQQRETERGNIIIPFYSKDQFEFIYKINAVSYTMENGSPVTTSLTNKAVFTEKVDNIYSQVRFAIPNVKEGSIIEYEYTSIKKHYGGLMPWKFQHDIPVIKSCYSLYVIPNSEFQYAVQKKNNYPIVIKSAPESGKIYFEMNNIPGLKFEPYMDAANDYLQKVEFQLSQYMNRFGDRTKTAQTWEGLAQELISHKGFGGALKKSLPDIDYLKTQVAAQPTDSGKVALIYNYVRHNFNWNGYYAIYAAEGLKNVWEQKKGNAAEINLLLINLLRKFDIETYPLLVAERHYGKININYPFTDRFNKVAAYARSGSQIWILDATQRFTPPGLTPYPLLNTIAFLVDRKEHKLVKILSTRHNYNNTILVHAAIDTAGLLKGTAEIRSTGYAAQLRIEKIRTDRKNFIKDVLNDPGSEWVVDDCTFDNLDDDSRPLIQNLSFHQEYDPAGGFAFLTCNMFTGFSKNPFTAEERFTNINFGYPYRIKLEAKIQLPANALTDTLPGKKVVASPDKSTVVTREWRLEDNILIATVSFTQDVTLVENDRYDEVKELYKQITDLLNEKIVIKINP